MNEDYTPKIPTCEQCGNDRPWARETWVVAANGTFCSVFCAENRDYKMAGIILRGKFNGSNREALDILSRVYKPRQVRIKKYDGRTRTLDGRIVPPLHMLKTA